jgi:predicted GNAT family N-acyltransferase
MPTTAKVLLLAWEDARIWAAPLRYAVFVQEQGVPEELEWDDQDARSVHAVILDAECCLGTGRMLPAGDDGCASIGRMAVRHDRRGEGVGRLLLRALLTEATHQNVHEIVLHAQMSAVGFYDRFGFARSGCPFQEAGITHVEMRLVLKSTLKE